MIVIFFSRFDYTKLKKYGKPLYVINLLMLVAVMFVGTSALGAQRWIQLGPITLQPSEFSKLIMIILHGGILSDRVGQLNKWRQVLPIGLYVGIPFLLVLKQPDLGTSLVFLAITLGMLFVGRIKMSLLRNVFLAGIVLAPVAGTFSRTTKSLVLRYSSTLTPIPLGPATTSSSPKSPSVRACSLVKAYSRGRRAS
mgnify:CR=1 FL=1